MNDWQECRLSDLSVTITKGTTPTTLGLGYVETGINFIKSESISYAGRIDRSKFQFIDQHTHERLNRSQLKANDILFSMAGVFLGKSALVPDDCVPANTNQALAIIRLDPEQAVPRFISYYLRQPSMIDLINNYSGQSAQPNINLAEIGSLEIMLPPLEEQQAIAAVLSSLDDKIDLLHRLNKTLAALAQTLFRHWFIDNADASWIHEVGNLPIDIIDGDRGRNYPKNAEFLSEGYCLFLNAKNVTEDGFSFDNCSFITKEKDEILRGGKLARQDTVLTTRGTVGNVAFYHDLIRYDHIRINSGMVIFRSASEDLPPLYLYILLSSAYFHRVVTLHMSGSAQPQLPIRDIRNIEIIVPSRVAVDKFMEVAFPIYDRIHMNQSQIFTLENLRDTLLPKLMNGEVRVRH